MLIEADLTNFGLIVELVGYLVEALLDDLEIDLGGFLGADLDRSDTLDLSIHMVHLPADKVAHMVAEKMFERTGPEMDDQLKRRCRYT